MDRSLVGWCLAAILALACVPVAAAPPPAIPVLRPEVGWLHLPNGWRLGEVTAVAVDRQDRLWLLQRPRSLAVADRAHAAPPVLVFDRQGRYRRGFGGPGAGYDWPTVEHSLAVDGQGRAWITGNFRTPGQPGDDMLLCFDRQGRFLRQIGRRGGSRGDEDTANLHAPADLFVDDAAHEIYVADGYGNRRVIVFDTESGAFKRMWSAFGAAPPPDPAPDPRPAGQPFAAETGAGPPGFNGVHGVLIARDGLVYVSDRNNQRIQVFTRAGRYLRQAFVDRNLPSAQTVSGLAFSPDRAQRYLYAADWGNSRLLVLDRATLATLGVLGDKGAAPGQFLGPHLLAMDRHGTLYVAEVQGRRVQRLVPAAR